MAARLSDSLDDANDDAYEKFNQGEADTTVQECPGRSLAARLSGNAKRNLGHAKDKIVAFRDALKQKLRNVFTDEERATLEVVKGNVGGVPIINSHGMMVDAIFWRVNKDFGWDKDSGPSAAEER